MGPNSKTTVAMMALVFAWARVLGMAIGRRLLDEIRRLLFRPLVLAGLVCLNFFFSVHLEIGALATRPPSFAG